MQPHPPGHHSWLVRYQIASQHKNLSVMGCEAPLSTVGAHDDANSFECVVQLITKKKWAPMVPCYDPYVNHLVVS